MSSEVAQIYLAADADVPTFERALDRWCQAAPLAFAGRNLPGCWGAGDFSVDLRALGGASLEELPGVARVDRLSHIRIGGGERAPGLVAGVLRTLLLRVRPEAPAHQVEALERDLLAMPGYMRGIRNWQLGRVTSTSHWSHVWQQEFAEEGDLHGEYLLHPFHWGWVDRWFDPAFPEWTVEAICHAFCPLPASVLAPA
ncbi:Dabb family protein [Metapseudomonas boanensis]|uniref:Dabb family protein n=1 Tax=Metapseudomonas boanensis TaxID=2822138 RepID=A0ABS5XEJ8_9GAMM|nr:Dabb family protein [Pseudomonas boanensis]MBT8766072.1 Dabb family protein [Pseudomonas boanensis]